MSVPTTDIETVDGDLPPGTQVGEYTVESKLGQGAFGIVFKASHPLIGKLVAIKVLSLKFSVDPEMVSRFVAEARAVNQIRNRHIIDIFSFGKLPDGRQYYVMEYLDGETLDALVEHKGRLELGEALPILRGIGRALDAAHGKGIAHRDLKAENVFLASDPDGGVFPKLLDFGIAKLLGSDESLAHKTRTGMSIGTPYYMSPEQARAKDVDHRTDIYAFGVLCYVVLTGKYPHDGDDYMSILMKQCTADPEPPSKHVPELPKAVDDVVLWLMQKDPADRPDCLRTAVAALETAAVDAGIVIRSASWDIQTGPTLAAVPTRPPSAPRPAAPSVVTAAPRRSRAPIFALVTAALVVGAGITYVATRHPDEHPTPVAVPSPSPSPSPPPSPSPSPSPSPPPSPSPSPSPSPPPSPSPSPPPAAAPPSRHVVQPKKKKPASPTDQKKTTKDDIIDVFPGGQAP